MNGGGKSLSRIAESLMEKNEKDTLVDKLIFFVTNAVLLFKYE